MTRSFQGNPVTVHVLQTLVLYECEKHPREEDWEEAHVGDRISGILMQLISCLQVDTNTQKLSPSLNVIITHREETVLVNFDVVRQ